MSTRSNKNIQPYPTKDPIMVRALFVDLIALSCKLCVLRCVAPSSLMFVNLGIRVKDSCIFVTRVFPAPFEMIISNRFYVRVCVCHSFCDIGGAPKYKSSLHALKKRKMNIQIKNSRDINT